MLELRPVCENCNKPLPPESTEARICSYECTFCADCVDQVLYNVCPNCGGGFQPRPIRPSLNWRNNNCVEFDPPTSETKFRPVDADAHLEFAVPIRNIPPEKR